MDPNENLREQLALASKLSTHDNGEADRLAELVIELHEWLGRGGHLPSAWVSEYARHQAREEGGGKPC